MATDLGEILTDLNAEATRCSGGGTAAATDARLALSRLRPALDRLRDDGLDTGASTMDPDAFTRQTERVHWVRLLANTCARLGAATPAPTTLGPMTRLADAAGVAAVLHADVLTSGQRWAIVACFARTANHLVAVAGGGSQSSPDVDRALIIAEASSGVLFQFATLDSPAAPDYAALHHPVPDPSSQASSIKDAVLEASAGLVHATRPGTGPHSIADVLAIATAAATTCRFVVSAELGAGDHQVSVLAQQAARAWGDLREQLDPFNDGSRRLQIGRPPAVDHALILHRLLRTPLQTQPAPSPEQLPGAATVAVVRQLATIAAHLAFQVDDGVARGRFMAYAADLPIRESRVRAFLAGRRAVGLVTVDVDDAVPLRSALLQAQVSTAALGASVEGPSAVAAFDYLPRAHLRPSNRDSAPTPTVAVPGVPWAGSAQTLDRIGTGSGGTVSRR